MRCDGRARLAAAAVGTRNGDDIKHGQPVHARMREPPGITLIEIITVQDNTTAAQHSTATAHTKNSASQSSSERPRRAAGQQLPCKFRDFSHARRNVKGSVCNTHNVYVYIGA